MGNIPGFLRGNDCCFKINGWWMLKIAFESSLTCISCQTHTDPDTSEKNWDVNHCHPQQTAKSWLFSKRKESAGKKQYFFEAILSHTNKCTWNLAFLSIVRLKQQGTVSLLSIHSHLTQDSTSPFSDLSWSSCTCLFKYKWLLMALSFCSCSIYSLIVTHTSKICVAMSFLLPHPCCSSFQHLSYSPLLCPTASHQELTRDTVSSVTVWVTGARITPTK